MDWSELIINFAALAAVLGGCFKFFWSALEKKFDQIDKKFDQIDKKFDQIEKKFESIDSKLENIRLDIRSIDSRLSRLEGQDEERFRHKIELYVKGKEKTE